MRSVITAILAVFVASLSAQTRNTQFDVASIHENRSGLAEGSLGPTRDGYEATNIPARLLVVRAFNVRAFQVVGGPAWIDSVRFDLVGRGSDNTTEEQARLMLQQLLFDRFKLRVRTEMRELPVYDLIVARTTGALGPQLKPSTAECTEAPRGVGNPCGMSGSFGTGHGDLEAVGQPLDRLATQLSTAVNRIVINKTGLAGRFDFHISWGAGGFGSADAGRPDDAPSIFTTVQEQLGLKLMPNKGPVQVVVVDHIERPTEN